MKMVGTRRHSAKATTRIFSKGFGQLMLCIQSPVVAQGELGGIARGCGGVADKLLSAKVLRAVLSGREALEIARERFPNLCCGGILPRKAIGEPVDLDDIEVALEFLSQCRRTLVPRYHTFDLRRAIPGDVRLGAVICAATALGFDVRRFYGNVEFGVHAMIAVNANDVKRVAGSAT
jgi:hypothetical protein